MAIINDKAALLGAAQRKEELVKVGEGEVRVVELGAVDYLNMLAACEKELQKEPILVVVGSWACVDESGQRLFTLDEFKTLNRETQFKLGGAAMKLNWPEGALEKNAQEGEIADSASDSL